MGTGPCWLSVFSLLPPDCYCELYNFVNVNLAFARIEARKASEDDTMRPGEAPVVLCLLLKGLGIKN